MAALGVVRETAGNEGEMREISVIIRIFNGVKTKIKQRV